MRQDIFTYKSMSYGIARWRHIPTTDSAEHEPSALVLVHGFAQSACSWSVIAPLFVRTHEVYAFELLGHGHSQKPADPEAYSLKRQAASLLAFLESLATQDYKPEVIAYSMGGRVALNAAAMKPQAFGCLLLESVGLGPQSDQKRLEARNRDMHCAMRLRRDGLSAFMDYWEGLALFASQRNLPEQVQKSVRAHRMSNDVEALARSFEQAGQHTMDDAQSSMRALEALRVHAVRVGYVTGGYDNKYRALAHKLEALCDVQVVKGAGHNVHLENPHEFYRVASRFLSCAVR